MRCGWPYRTIAFMCLHCLYGILDESDFLCGEGILVIELLVDGLYRLAPINVGLGGEVLERDERIYFACCMLRVLFEQY